MGRPPSNGVPSFRFTASEVAEMESVLRKHQNQMPANEILTELAEKFSSSSERSENSKQRKKKNDKSGKVVVQMKQVWNWFQNRRFAIRAKGIKIPGAVNKETIPKQGDSTAVRNTPQAPPPTMVHPPTAQAGLVKSEPEKPLMEFEARSANDGAWYDVAEFLSLRSSVTGEMEVQARFSGFGEEEVEWLNVRKHVRQRSLPCESSECFIVLPGDLILCFQEGKEQALYFDAHVLNAQRRNHDVRGCRCRFLVRYDHNHSEEIVPLRKICRRPETDYRLQQVGAGNIIPLNTEALPPPDEAIRYPSAPRCNNLAVASMDTQVSARVESITVRTEGNMEISIVASAPNNNKTAEESDDIDVTAQFPKPSDAVQASKIDSVIANDSVSNATAAAVTTGVPDNAVHPGEPVSNAAAATVTSGVPANAVPPEEPVSSATSAAVAIGVPANAVPPEEPVSNATAAAAIDGVLANAVQLEEPVSNATTSAVTSCVPANAVHPEEPVLNEAAAAAAAVKQGVLINTVLPEEPVSDATSAAVTNGVLANAVQPEEPVPNPAAAAVPYEEPVSDATAAEITNGILANAAPLEEPVSNATAAAITNGVLANTVSPAGAMSDPKANVLSDDAPADAMDITAAEENSMAPENSEGRSCVAEIVENRGDVESLP